MTGNHLGWLAGGLILLAFASMCWSGSWRRWVQLGDSGYPRWMFITLVPGFGTLGVAFGISPLLSEAVNVAVFGVGMLAAFVGFVLMFWEPAWYGPRWFREINRAFSKNERASLAYMAEDGQHPGESSVEATYRHQTSGRPMPPAEWVRLVSDPGGSLSGMLRGRSILEFYPQAPILGGHDENKAYRYRTIAAESLRAVRKLEPGMELDGTVRRSGLRSRLVPRVRIDTGEGSWLLETRKAKRVVREIERRYLDPTTNIYGMALPHGESPGFSYALRGAHGNFASGVVREEAPGEGGDRLAVYPSWWKLVLFALVSLAFVVLGFWIGVSSGGVSQADLGGTIVAYFGVPLFGLCFVYSLYRLVVRKPLVAVSEEGIFDNSPAIGAGMIGWEEIEGFYTFSSSGQPMLGIIPEDEREILARQNPIKRLVILLNNKFLRSPRTIFVIHQSALPMTVGELVSEIENRTTNRSREPGRER